jgi:hypothetical protein
MRNEDKAEMTELERERRGTRMSHGKEERGKISQERENPNPFLSFQLPPDKRERQ